MSDKVGPLSFSKDSDNTLYKPFSEKTAQTIDREAEVLVSSAYERALTILREHRSQLNDLAEALLAREVIGTDDLVKILGPRREADMSAPDMSAPSPT